MKKQSVLLMLLAVLFTASITTSCKKKDNKPKDDEEQPGGGNGGGGNTANTGLNGSDYYLLALDPTTEAKIHSKVTKDYRVDEANRFLFVWDNTYIAGTPSGPNAFGVVESWISLAVNNGTTWSGLGSSPDGKSTIDLSSVTDSHVLHFAMKSKNNATHVIGLSDGANEAKIAIGTSAFLDNTTTIQPYTDFKRDGEWHHIEIPISEFTKKGLKYRAGGFSTGNIFLVLSGGVAGTTLDIDGVFIYKKAN